MLQTGSPIDFGLDILLELEREVRHQLNLMLWIEIMCFNHWSRSIPGLEVLSDGCPEAHVELREGAAKQQEERGREAS